MIHFQMSIAALGIEQLSCRRAVAVTGHANPVSTEAFGEGVLHIALGRGSHLGVADEFTATVLTESGDERTIELGAVDKARTVFEWSPKPKPGKGPGNTKGKQSGQTPKQPTTPTTTNLKTTKKEKQKS